MTDIAPTLHVTNKTLDFIELMGRAALALNSDRGSKTLTRSAPLARNASKRSQHGSRRARVTAGKH